MVLPELHRLEEDPAMAIQVSSTKVERKGKPIYLLYEGNIFANVHRGNGKPVDPECKTFEWVVEKYGMPAKATRH